MSYPQDVQTQNVKEKRRVHVDLPKVVWDLVGEIAERYRMPKVDVLTVLVISEARRLGIEIKTLDK